MNSLTNQIRRRILELCMLEIISRGEVYITDMLDELKSAELIGPEGTLYPVLYRFRKASLVTVKSEDSESGPPKKFYSLTPEGSTTLANLRENWEALVQTVQVITSKTANS